MSSVTVFHAVAIFSVFAVGLIAGQMLAISIANYAARGLPETSWTLRFQSENDLFAKTMPPFLIAPAIGLLALFFLHIMIPLDVRRSRRAHTDRSGNNDGDECADQQAGAILDCRSAPSTWMFTRDRWLRFHLARTVVGLISFAIAAIGLTSL